MKKNAQASAYHAKTPPVKAPLTVTHKCRINAITPLNADAFQVELQAPDDTVLEYLAGQYLQLELDVKDEEASRPLLFSIANGFDSEHTGRLQLFIYNNSALSHKTLQHLTQRMEENQSISVMLPMGKAYLQTDLSLPHVFIAAGSGISQVKCLVEETLRQRPGACVKLYWSNREVEEFYLQDTIQAWQATSKRFSFTPVLESAHSGWSGASGYLYEVIQKDFEDLSGVQVYLCGSPQMVYGTIDKLKNRGLTIENCYSDVFEYAPRNTGIDGMEGANGVK